MAALSSYENRPISTGVLLLGRATTDPCRPGVPRATGRRRYSQALTGIKSFYRLCRRPAHGVSGQRTTAACSTSSTSSGGRRAVPARAATCRAPRALPRARARDARHGHVCVVLSPSREIKVFAEGAPDVHVPRRRWHLLDLQAKYDLWAEAVGDAGAGRAAVPDGARSGRRARRRAVRRAARPRAAVPQLVAPGRSARLHVRAVGQRRMPPRGATCCTCCAGGSATDLDPACSRRSRRSTARRSIDRTGRLLAAARSCGIREPPEPHSNAAVEGARTTAAMAASRFGPVLKVSEDGVITFFDSGTGLGHLTAVSFPALPAADCQQTSGSC